MANHTILTPVSPQMVAEPSPQKAFQPQLSSTPNPRDSLTVDGDRAQRFYEWYMGRNGQGTPWGPSAVPTASVLRSTLPGTPFRGPYPSFDLAQDRAPSATPHLFPQPHRVGTAAPCRDTPLFLPGDHAPSPVLSRHTPVGPPPVPPYPQYDPYVPPTKTLSGHASFHGEPPIAA